LRALASTLNLARFAYRYAAHFGDRFTRAAIAATEGPAFYKRSLWKRYLTPDPAFQPIPLGPQFQRYLEQLREEGMVAITGHFEETAQRLRELLGELELTRHRRMDSVTDFEIDVGLSQPAVLRMLAHPELCGLFCNYYGRQAYYREHPLLLGMSAGAAGVDRSSSRVHCDGYRQITLHLLVNDVSAEDTHLIYYTGTHKQPKLDYTRVPENSNLVAKVPTKLGTGRAGTLTVFDSGSGYHAGEYKPGQRILLSTVVTTGWLPFRDAARSDEDALRVMRERQPPHVRAMFERL
jgi:hypothetical protein